MAVKTFTTGEVLTAADTNTYLNNGGLVYIGAVTATSGSTIQVDNVFSATYDSYRVVVSDLRTAAATAITYKLRNSGGVSSASYYWGGIYLAAYGTATVTATTTANTSSFDLLSVASATSTGFTFDVMGPFLAQRTTITGIPADNRTGGNPRIAVSGFHDVSTSYTGFDIISTQTITNAIVRVYGYRQA